MVARGWVGFAWAFVGSALAGAACAGPAVGPVLPPTKSELYLQTVTYACESLRAEFTVQGNLYVRGLFVAPDCPTAGMQTTNCYRPPADHPPCSFSCPQLTYWKKLGGTAPMHTFTFPLDEDGTNSGVLIATVHVRLSTLYDTLIWEGDQSEALDPLSDHRAGYHHTGLMEMQLDGPVLDTLGQNCLD